MMFKQYREMSPLDFNVNDNQIDEKQLGGLFIFVSLASQTSYPKAFPPDLYQVISVSTDQNHHLHLKPCKVFPYMSGMFTEQGYGNNTGVNPSGWLLSAAYVT